jgi:hypothetical protein
MDPIHHFLLKSKIAFVIPSWNTIVQSAPVCQVSSLRIERITTSSIASMASLDMDNLDAGPPQDTVRVLAGFHYGWVIAPRLARIHSAPDSSLDGHECAKGTGVRC